MGQSWLISGRRVRHFRPRDGRFLPILAIFGAPRRLISVKLRTLTRPILVDTGGPKRPILVRLEAVGGAILVNFGPPSGGLFEGGGGGGDGWMDGWRGNSGVRTRGQWLRSLALERGDGVEGGVWDANVWVPKMAPPDFPNFKFRFSPRCEGGP